MKNVYIVAAKRTAFGSFGGSLKDLTATELGSVAARAAIAQSGATADAIDACFMGNVAHTDPSAPYLARHVALKAGCAVRTPALTVNRLCGSGFQAVVSGAQNIVLGESQVVLVGGAENMSLAPYLLSGATVRWGTGLGPNLDMVDSLWATLTDQYIKTPMGMTAENLAASHSISREACDEYALLSQRRYAEALASGAFANEICPVEVKTKKGPVSFERDEHPRANASAESLAKLGPVFKRDGGVVTAGNASGIADGAGALLLASEEACKRHNYKPIARVVNWGISGCDPKVMGIGPVPAIQQLLARTGRSLDTIDYVEVNEAFASQYLAVEKDLKLNRDRTNVHGGAIAMGHPVGTSGARILAHLAYLLQSSGKSSAIGSACIGGGQGIAVLLERV